MYIDVVYNDITSAIEPDSLIFLLSALLLLLYSTVIIIIIIVIVFIDGYHQILNVKVRVHQNQTTHRIQPLLKNTNQ